MLSLNECDAGRAAEKFREVAEWMDRQRAVWSRFMDVVDEYLKEEGTK